MPGLVASGELFRDGFLVAVANPEIILFLAVFLPPFVDMAKPAVRQILALSAIFITISAGAGSLLAVRARQFLSGGRLKWIDYPSQGACSRWLVCG